MATRQEFDELVRKEIARAGGGSQRGGDASQAARDRVARRLNAQEGRSRNSTAYTPSAPKKAASSGGKGVTTKKKGPGKKRAPGSQLPATTDVVPTPRPTDQDQSGIGAYLIPLLMAGALGGVAGRRAFRGRAPAAGPEAAATGQGRYPWDQPSAPAAEPPTVRAPVPAEAPSPIEPSNPRFGTVAPEDVGGLNEAQIRDIINRASGMPSAVETGGDVGARAGGDVYRPGVGAASPSPGLHGSRFGQPIIKPRVIVRP